jgi:type I restriction enzyme, S subunit
MTLPYFEIALPSDGMMHQYSDIAGSAFKQRENLAHQNQKLHAAGDLLLPRLISREVAV